MTDFGGILATTFSYVGSFYQACGKEGTVTILDISCAPKVKYQDYEELYHHTQKMPQMGENDLAKAFWRKKKKRHFYDFLILS